MGLESNNLAASVPCMNTLLGGKLAFSSLHSGQSNQFAYVLSPPAIAAVQEPCTGVIHHLPVYPIQLRNNGSAKIFFATNMNFDPQLCKIFRRFFCIITSDGIGGEKYCQLLKCCSKRFATITSSATTSTAFSPRRCSSSTR